MAIAGCRFCGNTAADRKPGGELGNPAGPCARCGHLMFWMTDEEARGLRPERLKAHRFSARVIARAVEARRGLRPGTGPSPGRA